MSYPLKQNETAKQLKKVQHNLAYIDRQTARMKDLDRKQDTRRKIQLGGLVKKSGLENETTAVLYGLLLEAKEKLESETGEQTRSEWRLLGDLNLP